MYVIVKNGVAVQRVAEAEVVRWDDDHICTVGNLTPEQRTTYGVFLMKFVAPPVFDPLVSNCSDTGAALSTSGEWVQRWEITPASPAEIRRRGAAAAQSALEAGLCSGVTVDGILYPCDGVFQAQVVAFVVAHATGVLQLTDTVTVRDMTNAMHDLSKKQVTAVAATLLQHVQGLYASYWAAKDKLPTV